MKNNFILIFCVFAITQIISGEEPTKFCATLEDNSYEICMDNVIPKIGHLFLDDDTDVPEIDPLKIESVTIYKKMNKDVEFRGLIEDIVVHGLKDTILEGARLDPITFEGYVHLTIPSIYAKSKYFMSMKFANMNRTYSGVSSGNASDIDLQFYFQLEKVTKADVEYFAIKHMKGKIFVRKAQVTSKAFDPAEQSTADFFVEYFNKNYKRLLNAPDSMFQKHALTMIRIVADEFLSGIPAEKFLEE